MNKEPTQSSLGRVKLGNKRNDSTHTRQTPSFHNLFSAFHQKTRKSIQRCPCSSGVAIHFSPSNTVDKLDRRGCHHVKGRVL